MIPWTFDSAAEAIEAAECLEHDAAYLQKCAANYAEKQDSFMVERVTKNAKHSAGLAMEIRAKYEAGSV
jgi:hypothetical protein